MVDRNGLASLELPAQSKPGKDAFNTQPKEIERWVTSLPMANPGETSRRVFRALVDMNRQDIGGARRFKALELLREPVNYVADTLKTHFIGRAFPLPARNRKIAELARALYWEMATGYQAVAKSLLRRPLFVDKRTLNLALHRAMCYIGMALLRSYQSYAPCPVGCWFTLHRLYAYAEQNGLLKRKLKDKYNTRSKSTSIEQLYKRIVLLALSNPYSLHQDDIVHVVKLLAEEADGARIRYEGGGGDLFIIELEGDGPPVYTKLKRAFAGDRRYLDTSALVRQLLQRQDAEGKIAGTPLSGAMIHSLLDSWSTVPHRNSSRSTKPSQVEAVLGLTAAHHFVSGEFSFTAAAGDTAEVSNTGDSAGPVFQSKSQFTSHQIHQEGEEASGPDIWDVTFSYDHTAPGDDVNAAENKPAGAAVGDAEYSIQSLRMRNSSASGYCLICDSEHGCTAHVGDLIAVRETGANVINQWGIGVIRRLRQVDGNELELGVQMLTPNAVAVAAKSVTAGGRDYARSLMIPELRAINQPATLITPILPFDSGHEVRVNMHGREIQLTLSTIVEKTASFAQFEFEVTRPAETMPPDGARGGAGEFEDLWETL